ncbi:MAG: DUF2341 domain-containing protein [Acidobacteria bacterium]|nr:DUF2341 domain-containing protein [Acidobacteriota bacterium]
MVGTSTVNRDAAEVHGGVYSVRLDISAANDYAAIQQADVPLKRPLDYCLSGWYKTEAGKTAQILVLNSGVADVYMTATGTWTTDVTLISLAAATAWTRFAIYFTPHPSYTLYNFAFLRDEAASSSIWFDDLSIAAWPSYYLKEMSFAQGGAGVTPDPIAGAWGAMIRNDDGIFHPRHPTSEFVDLLRVGRKVRLSVGGKYNQFAAPLGAWAHRKLITLPIPTANLTDFPVEVPIVAGSPASIAIGAHCLASGYDLRFTAIDGVTLLPYERKSFAVVAGEATGIFWVKTNVATAGTYIWLYYGNAAATDVSVAGINEELVFNGEFDTDTPDWTPSNSTLASVVGGKVGNCLEITGTNTGQPLAIWTFPNILTIGQTYEFSTWVKSGTSGDVLFRARLLDPHWAGLVAIQDYSTGAWVRYSGTAIATHTDGIISLFQYYTTLGTILFDTASLKPFHSTDWSNYGFAQQAVADGGLTWGAEETPQVANYSKYWPRMVGYMDPPKFQAATKTVALSGGDSMKALADTELRSPDNYWGDHVHLSSVETTKTFGSELYFEYDALDTVTDGDEVPNWGELYATFASVADNTLGSTYVGELVKDNTHLFGWTGNGNVAAVTVGKVYECTFAYKRTAGTGALSCYLYAPGTTDKMAQVSGLVSDVAATVEFHFTAATTGNVPMYFWIFTDDLSASTFRIDDVSIREVTARVNTRYPMPATCNGVYYVVLDGVPLWYGDDNQGWLHDSANNVFYFDDKTWLETGTNNLVVYYFTTQQILDVLGDVLASTPLYANRAAALAAMHYVDPLIAVPKVWFEGTSALAATQKICELCNYRFWFDELDAPHFIPAPTHGDAAAWFSAKTCSDAGDFQDLEEVRNRIVIQGIELGAFSTAKDKKTSRMACADTHDDASIAAHLEKTHSITNDLFQDQAAMDAMAATLLAAFKDPKLYSDRRVPKNPIPLERGDTIEWDIELRPPTTPGGADGLKNTVRGIIRDASFSGDGFNYKCEMRSTAMNVANYAAGPVTVTAEHCKGWALTNAGAAGDVHFDLPAAVVGMEITFYVMAAQTLTVDPNGTERIAVLTGTAGDYLRSDNVIGSCITLVCLVAGFWHKCGVAVGTWSEE